MQIISIESKQIQMMKIYCNFRDKYKKIENPKKSYIFKKTRSYYCFQSCSHFYKKILKKRTNKIIGLITI